MPSGIILKSASHEVSDEVRQKNLEAVMTGAGYEVEKPAEETPAVPAEPKRDDFKSEEEFEAAHVEWQDKQEAKEVEEDDEKEEKEEKAAPKKSRRERSIERATAPLLKRIQELEAKSGKTEKKDEPPLEAPRPKRADFPQDEEGQQKYEDALLAWGVDKAKKEGAVKDAEAANKTRFEENLVSYGTQVEEAKETYDDWDEVVNQEIFIGKEVQLAILENRENAADVIYYLGKHPVYAKKLGEMTPLSAIMEVGRLSLRLKTGASASDEANGGVPAKPKPKVPAPVRTVNTAGSSAALTFAEIAAKPNYPGKAKDLKRAMAAGH